MLAQANITPRNVFSLLSVGQDAAGLYGIVDPTENEKIILDMKNYFGGLPARGFADFIMHIRYLRTLEWYYLLTGNAFLQREGEVEMSNLEKSRDSGERNNPENATQNNSKIDITETNKLFERWAVNEIRNARIVLFMCIPLLLLLFT